MKKLLILLIIPIFILFLNTKYTTATYLSDTYGKHLSFTTLSLYTDFDFTESMWKNGNNVCVFEFVPIEVSLEEYLRALNGIYYPNIMKVYHYEIGTYEFVDSTGGSLTNNIGWTIEDGYLYIMIKESWFIDQSLTGCESWLVTEVLAQETNVDTWIFKETTDYDTGYQDGYKDAMKDTTSKIMSSVLLLIGPILLINIALLILKEFKTKD